VQEKVARLLGRHYRLHPLVPIEGVPNAETNAVVLRANEIWLLAVHEMYSLCRSKNLPAVFRYLRKNWYRSRKWCLRALSSGSNSKNERPCLWKLIGRFECDFLDKCAALLIGSLLSVTFKVSFRTHIINTT
jgi:hypothetical protein